MSGLLKRLLGFEGDAAKRIRMFGRAKSPKLSSRAEGARLRGNSPSPVAQAVAAAPGGLLLLLQRL